LEKIVKNWLDSAEYDLETADQMFKTGRYIYAVFMCHLALEKALKAKVQEITGKTPPKTHNLMRLVDLAQLSLDEEMGRYLSKLSNLSIPTRYPEDFQKLVEAFTKDKTEDIFLKAKEVYQWIKKSLSL
jgi:HEPN domain-containing protein